MSNENRIELYTVLEKYLKPNETQKKNNGEVFTPLNLVNEMLDKLPVGVWSNPGLKWLDPAVGIGNFPILIYERLMKGLEVSFPDKKERSTHIINKMIYVSDICPINISIYKLLMKQTKNVLVSDFLNPETFKGIKFDVIVGNPPYQNQSSTGKATGNSLWDKFVVKSLHILHNKGHLSLIHPSAWRKPESSKSIIKLFDLMAKQNQILYLEIHNTKDGIKTFNCGTRYDWYIIQKTPNSKNTLILDENGEQGTENLLEWDFLPNHSFVKVKKLIEKTEKFCNIICNSNYHTTRNHVSSVKTSELFPLIHSTPKGGIRYKYSSRNDKGHFGIPKVIFGDSGINNCIIDSKGLYGMTEHSMAISVEENFEEVKKYLDSNEFKNILKACSWSNYQIDWRLFTYFRKDFWKETSEKV
jgi:hypothetical protein